MSISSLWPSLYCISNFLPTTYSSKIFSISSESILSILIWGSFLLNAWVVLVKPNSDELSWGCVEVELGLQHYWENGRKEILAKNFSVKNLSVKINIGSKNCVKRILCYRKIGFKIFFNEVKKYLSVVEIYLGQKKILS